MVKVFKDPLEDELNRFLADVEVQSIHVATEPSYFFNQEEASCGHVMMYIFYQSVYQIK